MNIKRDFDSEQEILTKVKEHIAGDTNRENLSDIHVSDLLWCLRQSYYKKTNPDIELTMDEVLKFFKGKISEYSIGKFIFQDEHFLQQEKINVERMVAHPDIISHKDDIVIELKLTDKLSFIDPRDILYNSFIYYTTQVLYYMYLAGKKSASIVINHANYNMFYKKYNITKKEDKNPFRVFRIELEEDKDIPLIKADLDFKRDLLLTALKERKVGYIPKLSTIDSTNTAKCNKCQFKGRCKLEPDYWENNSISRVTSITKSGSITEFLEPAFVEFVKKYGGSHAKFSDVNLLYQTLGKKFDDLGPYYK